VAGGCLGGARVGFEVAELGGAAAGCGIGGVGGYFGVDLASDYDQIRSQASDAVSSRWDRLSASSLASYPLAAVASSPSRHQDRPLWSAE
jgi:hypothetical protein